MADRKETACVLFLLSLLIRSQFSLNYRKVHPKKMCEGSRQGELGLLETQDRC